MSIYYANKKHTFFIVFLIISYPELRLKDILIACIDNLKGFSEAIESIYTNTDVQLCIVHQVRNSLRYVPYTDSKAIIKDMKSIYHAPTKEQADKALELFGDKWQKKYPRVVDSWRNNWDRLHIRPK